MKYLDIETLVDQIQGVMEGSGIDFYEAVDQVAEINDLDVADLSDLILEHFEGDEELMEEFFHSDIDGDNEEGEPEDHKVKVLQNAAADNIDVQLANEYGASMLSEKVITPAQAAKMARKMKANGEKVSAVIKAIKAAHKGGDDEKVQDAIYEVFKESDDSLARWHDAQEAKQADRNTFGYENAGEILDDAVDAIQSFDWDTVEETNESCYDLLLRKYPDIDFAAYDWKENDSYEAYQEIMEGNGYILAEDPSYEGSDGMGWIAVPKKGAKIPTEAQLSWIEEGQVHAICGMCGKDVDEGYEDESLGDPDEWTDVCDECGLPL